MTRQVLAVDQRTGQVDATRRVQGVFNPGQTFGKCQTSDLFPVNRDGRHTHVPGHDQTFSVNGQNRAGSDQAFTGVLTEVFLTAVEQIVRGEEITAICAIGQPGQFFDFLQDYNIKEMIPFDDHHQYELKDIDNIKGNVVTTEKDAVKLQKFEKDNIYALKLKTDLNVEELLNGQTKI